MAPGRSYRITSCWIHCDKILHIIVIEEEHTTIVTFAAEALGGGGSDVLLDESQVADGCFFLLQAIFSDALGCESREGGQIAETCSFLPG